MLEREESGFLKLPIEPMTVEPVTLQGQVIRLEPLTMAHHAALCEVGFDEALWRYIPSGGLRTPDDMKRYMEKALKNQSQGMELPFATIECASGKAIGSTRYMNIDKQNYHVEIGSTWIGKNWQRTAVNTEAKYVMLRHAFEVLGCIRVELKTDVLNEQSRNAILRIGAKQEGIFRHHMITSTGRIRDSVYFSIMDTEWPVVKAALEEKMGKKY